MKKVFLLILFFSLAITGCKLSGGDGGSSSGDTGGSGTGGGTTPPGDTGSQAESLLTNPLSSLCVADNGVYLFASRGGKVMKSTNGATFVVVDDTPRNLNSVHCAWNTTSVGFTGYLVGSAGQIFQYDGTTLAEMTSPVSTNLQAVFGPNVGNVLAVGDLGTVVHWDGSAWSEENPWDNGAGEAPDPLPDLYGVGGDETAMYVVGSNRTVLKRTSSTNWTKLSDFPATVPTNLQLNAIWVDITVSGQIFIVGEAGGILRSQNNGLTWEDQSAATSGLTALPLYGVQGTSSNRVFAVGDGGVILVYNGTIWAAYENPEEDRYSLYDVVALADEAFSVGADGTDTSANGVIMKLVGAAWQKWFF